MLVRSVLSLSVALLLIVVASPVRAEQGLPSQSMLSDMGLTSIVVMSDTDAMAIRGFGYSGYGYSRYDNKMATAYGRSYAKIQGYGASASSENGYNASSRRHASGNNNSFAGLVVKRSPNRRRGGNGYGSGHGSRPQPRPQVKKIVVFAGGSSYSSTD